MPPKKKPAVLEEPNATSPVADAAQAAAEEAGRFVKLAQYTALHIAIKKGYLDIVRLMLDAPPPLLLPLAPLPSDDAAEGEECSKELDGAAQNNDTQPAAINKHLAGGLGWEVGAMIVPPKRKKGEVNPFLAPKKATEDDDGKADDGKKKKTDVGITSPTVDPRMALLSSICEKELIIHCMQSRWGKGPTHLTTSLDGLHRACHHGQVGVIEYLFTHHCRGSGQRGRPPTYFVDVDRPVKVSLSYDDGGFAPWSHSQHPIHFALLFFLEDPTGRCLRPTISSPNTAAAAAADDGSTPAPPSSVPPSSSSLSKEGCDAAQPRWQAKSKVCEDMFELLARAGCDVTCAMEVALDGRHQFNDGTYTSTASVGTVIELVAARLWNQPQVTMRTFVDRGANRQPAEEEGSSKVTPQSSLNAQEVREFMFPVIRCLLLKGFRDTEIHMPLARGDSKDSIVQMARRWIEGSLRCSGESEDGQSRKLGYDLMFLLNDVYRTLHEKSLAFEARRAENSKIRYATNPWCREDVGKPFSEAADWSPAFATLFPFVRASTWYFYSSSNRPNLTATAAKAADLMRTGILTEGLLEDCLSHSHDNVSEVIEVMLGAGCDPGANSNQFSNLNPIHLLKCAIEAGEIIEEGPKKKSEPTSEHKEENDDVEPEQDVAENDKVESNSSSTEQTDVGTTQENKTETSLSSLKEMIRAAEDIQSIWHFVCLFGLLPPHQNELRALSSTAPSSSSLSASSVFPLRERGGAWGWGCNEDFVNENILTVAQEALEKSKEGNGSTPFCVEPLPAPFFYSNSKVTMSTVLSELPSTVLHRAVSTYRPCPYTVKALLEGGADPNMVDLLGRTPLHFARDSLECTALLIAFGANVNAEDYVGETPIFYSLFPSFLVAAGANLEHRNRRGETPFVHSSTVRCTDANQIFCRTLPSVSLLTIEESISEVEQLCGKPRTIEKKLGGKQLSRVAPPLLAKAEAFCAMLRRKVRAAYAPLYRWLDSSTDARVAVGSSDFRDGDKIDFAHIKSIPEHFTRPCISFTATDACGFSVLHLAAQTNNVNYHYFHSGHENRCPVADILETFRAHMNRQSSQRRRRGEKDCKNGHDDDGDSNASVLQSVAQLIVLQTQRPAFLLKASRCVTFRRGDENSYPPTIAEAVAAFERLEQNRKAVAAGDKPKGGKMDHAWSLLPPGSTLLHIAAMHNRYETLEKIAEFTIDIADIVGVISVDALLAVKDAWGRTCLDVAMEAKSEEFVKKAQPMIAACEDTGKKRAAERMRKM